MRTSLRCFQYLVPNETKESVTKRDNSIFKITIIVTDTSQIELHIPNDIKAARDKNENNEENNSKFKTDKLNFQMRISFIISQTKKCSKYSSRNKNQSG